MSSFCSSTQSTSVLIILNDFVSSENLIASLFIPFDLCWHLLIPSVCSHHCQLTPHLCSSLWAKSLSYSVRMEFLKGLGGRILSKAFCKCKHKVYLDQLTMFMRSLMPSWMPGIPTRKAVLTFLTFICLSANSVLCFY